MNALSLGLVGGSFRWACSSHLIEHFTEPEGHVRELARVLSADGTAYFLTPNAPADFENPFHIHLFEPDELRQMLGRHFEEVRVQGLDAVPHVKADFAARRVKAEKVLRLDVFDLRHKIPRRWYIGFYTRVLPIAYRLIARGDSAARRASRRTTSSSPTISTAPPWSSSPPRPARGGRTDRGAPEVLAVGLTGGIGTGKSTVATMLAERGAALVDADLIAREVVEPGGAAYQPLVDRFGSEILDGEGRVDRPALAALVFGDPEALADLNTITHPAIGVEMIARKDGFADTDRIVVLEIPLLRAVHRDTLSLAAVVVVDAAPEVALDRLVGRGGWTRRTREPGWPASPIARSDDRGPTSSSTTRATRPTSATRSTGCGLRSSNCVPGRPARPSVRAATERPASAGSRVTPDRYHPGWCPNSRSSRRSNRPATSPRPSPGWSRGSSAATGTRPCSASPGRGKTATIAWTIEGVQRPTLIIEPNKSLAAQLAAELKELFPRNRVEYFVSYYDYYQPEAYVPSSDTYIEKDSSINDEIDRLRHASTSSLLLRRDTIVVASVSCIYGLGSPDEYRDRIVALQPGDVLDQRALLRRLVDLLYTRSEAKLLRGQFRVRGDTVEIHPAYESRAVRVEFFGDTVERIRPFDVLTGEIGKDLEDLVVFANTHYGTGEERMRQAIAGIETELRERLGELSSAGKLLEAQRLRMRTEYDLEMLTETGVCSGIENYSRHLDGRAPGEAPFTLLDYFPKDYLVVLDESHVAVPQLQASTQATARGRRPWWTTGSASPPPWTTDRSASRSSSNGPVRRSCSRRRQGPGSSSTARTSSSRWCGRPDWSIPRSTSARRPVRSTICGCASTRRWLQGVGCW